MQKLMLLGDEAIAQGAIDAGMSGIYAYPGTPSTEITEYILQSKDAKEKKIRAGWSTNEKTAVEGALGMSYAGKRAMTCMKHVGLNVAADAFINSAITGANGGLIVVSADDPSMHSSQNEQDSRFYGNFAMIPILEPSNQQEAYDMVHYSFDLSEKYRIPVMMRITTRLAHSRAGVVRGVSRGQNEVMLPSNPKQFILLPGNARKQYKTLLSNQALFEMEASTSGFNKYIDGTDKKMGIIACGISFNYLMENFADRIVPYPVLKIGQYPVPVDQVSRLYNECDAVLVLEEGYPLIEEFLRGMLNNGKTVTGRLDGSLPRDGELSPNLVAKALGHKVAAETKIPSIVANRPPALCKGCPHIFSYNALNEAMAEVGKGRVFADIGCYTLGFMEPYHAIDTCVDMGASITMAKGAADAGLLPAVAVIGDSTFTHSGMTGLLDAVVDNSPITVFILDNETTGMTGGQDSNGLGKLEAICSGLGVDPAHIRVVSPMPKSHDENVRIIKEEIAYQGVSVIIPRRECIQTAARRHKADAKLKGKEA
ncbi:MAG: indolepyruvate ferredoxin oxidoreductase [Bacteroidetes bacterium]|nr:indolepyruvate ferredoxin oxidoreductase [Bacteroidota bacterium]